MQRDGDTLNAEKRTDHRKVHCRAAPKRKE